MLEQQRPAKITVEANGTELRCSGNWVTAKIAPVTKQIAYLNYITHDEITVDASQINDLDTVGAWMLSDLIGQFNAANKKARIVGLNPEHATLYSLISNEKLQIKEPGKHPSPGWVYELGKLTVEKYYQFLGFLTFFGEFTVDFFYSLRHPRSIQWLSFLNVIDSAGFRALPIIALLLFLIGIVISYQTGLQLKAFGASFYIVSLTGVAVLQEFGPLITAIILAGRTGAAFTSQIGSMKVNQEIDALRTMGLSPMIMLAIPRFFGLLVVMPLLTIWANIFGILGSMVMAKHVLDYSYTDYLLRFPKDIRIYTYLVGLAKAPVFAMVIATIGCYQGFHVEMSAESIGQQTTKSVVQAIFLIIIVDALFSVLFSWG